MGLRSPARVGACCRPNALRLKPHCLIIVHGGGNRLCLGQSTRGVKISVFSQRVFVTWCVAPASIKHFQVKSEQLPAIHRNPKWTTGEWFLKHLVIRYVLTVDSALLCCVKCYGLLVAFVWNSGMDTCVFAGNRLEVGQRRGVMACSNFPLP